MTRLDRFDFDSPEIIEYERRPGESQISPYAYLIEAQTRIRWCRIVKRQAGYLYERMGEDRRCIAKPSRGPGGGEVRSLDLESEDFALGRFLKRRLEICRTAAGLFTVGTATVVSGERVVPRRCSKQFIFIDEPLPSLDVAYDTSITNFGGCNRRPPDGTCQPASEMTSEQNDKFWKLAGNMACGALYDLVECRKALLEAELMLALPPS